MLESAAPMASEADCWCLPELSDARCERVRIFPSDVFVLLLLLPPPLPLPPLLVAGAVVAEAWRRVDDSASWLGDGVRCCFRMDTAPCTCGVSCDTADVRLDAALPGCPL